MSLFGLDRTFSSDVIFFPTTPSVPSYRSFDFFHFKFDYSSYSKICAKYQFFCCGLLHQYKFFNNELNLTMFS